MNPSLWKGRETLEIEVKDMVPMETKSRKVLAYIGLICSSPCNLRTLASWNILSNKLNFHHSVKEIIFFSFN